MAAAGVNVTVTVRDQEDTMAVHAAASRYIVGKPNTKTIILSQWVVLKIGVDELRY